MRLAIDIGNSTTHLAIYDRNRIVYLRKSPTHSDFAEKMLKSVKKKYTAGIMYAGISSVVKETNRKWARLVEDLFSIKPLIVSHRINLPIVLNIKSPERIGADRICNAVAGYEFFKRRENVIAVDFGTATTFDIVLKNGSYQGGIISPGIRTMAESLHSFTSMLPKLKSSELTMPRKIAGKNTAEAMKSGVVYASLAAFEGIVEKIKSEFKTEFSIILSGGFALLIHSSTKYKTAVNQNLVLDGINYLIGYNGGN